MHEHLIIGGHGLVGSALRRELDKRREGYAWTTRRRADGGIHLDLDHVNHDDLARLSALCSDTVYLVAAVTKVTMCERDKVGSWLVNVDAPIAIASACRGHSFIVYVSSSAVEYCGPMEYARQKTHVEAVMHAFGAAIVRPDCIAPGRVAEFVAMLADVGASKRPGVTRWQ